MALQVSVRLFHAALKQESRIQNGDLTCPFIVWSHIVLGSFHLCAKMPKGIDLEVEGYLLDHVSQVLVYDQLAPLLLGYGKTSK